MNNNVSCPNCKSEFPLDQVMSAQLGATIRSELETEFTEKNRRLVSERNELVQQKKQLKTRQEQLDEQVQKAIAKERGSIESKAQVVAQQAVSVEIKDRDQRLQEASERLKEFEQQELELRKKARQLEQQAEQQKKQLVASQEQLDRQVQEAIAKERGTIESKARVVAQQAVAVEIKDRDQRLQEASEKLKEFEQQELGLRKKARQLEQQAEQQELEIDRRLDEERKKIRDRVLAQAQEESKLKQAEKEHVIDSLRKKIDELKLKAEQGSQQIQGEVQEIALENMLSEVFLGDSIEPIAKGVRGADVLQHVFDLNGRDCGSILWESKRTKRWNDDWLSKVCDDRQEAKASCACIVSAVLPESVQYFGEIGDVWVADFSCVRSVAVAIRRVLIETAQARRATEGQQGKMELVYNYLSGPEFRNRVSGLVEPFVEMQADLDAEKRVIQTRWNKRRKLIDRALASTTGLYGDLQGIIGNGLQEIEGMDVLSLGVDEESE